MYCMRPYKVLCISTTGSKVRNKVKFEAHDVGLKHLVFVECDMRELS